MTAPADRLAAALADRYAIERELGAGGMATVYLAEDLRHRRQVAVKVLRPELAAVLGADRFVQEITTTASLQHPHILPLFDSGRARAGADGQGEAEFLYYVMPYMEGETLRERLEREHQLGVEDAVRIATDVADALDYAHRHGVIHRDIKPENILLHDNRPMVADFGIALAVSAAAGGRMTETGMSLGTPHYMSPEQATAEKDITGRSDVYSLGAVLYEMLTGEPPHTGGSAQAIIMKIVTEEAAPVTRVRKSVPPNVAAAVQKALERLPADRFDSAKAFAEALANPRFATAVAGTAEGSRAAPSRRRPFDYASPAIAVAATAVAVWALTRPPQRPAPIWHEMTLVEEPAAPPNIPILAMTADGDRILYAGRGDGAATRLWSRARSSLRAQPVPGTDWAVQPVVSPDGDAVAFLTSAPARLRIVPVVGGAATTVIDSAVPSMGFAWGDDGYLYLGYPDGLKRVPAAGGDVEVLFSDPGGARWPDVLPGSDVILFTYQEGGEDHIVAYRPGSGERRALGSGMFARYSASGHLLIVTSLGTLMAAPFDRRSLTVGTPVSVQDGLRVQPAGFVDLAVSSSGRLAYIAGPSLADPVDEAVWVDREGVVTPVDPDWKFSSSGNSGWAISPDGGGLAIKLNGETGQNLWIRDFASGTTQRITFEPGNHYRPRWSADGRSILYITDQIDGEGGGVYERRADGTGAERLVLQLREPIFEAQVSPDGEWLVARTSGFTSVSSGTRDVWAKRLTGDTALVPLLVGPADDRAVMFSPDGRWIAYVSDASGVNEVYIRPFPNVNDGQWQVSVGGGAAPLWAHNGRELFYVNPASEMVVADLADGPSRIRGRRTLFSLAGYRQSTNYTWFDLDPKDERFLMVRESPDAGRLIVVENFFAELEARVR